MSEGEHNPGAGGAGTGAPPAGNGATPPGGGGEDWRATLPEDLRGESFFKDAPDVATALKRGYDAHREIGRRLRPPSDDASPEQVAAWDAELAKTAGKHGQLIRIRTDDDQSVATVLRTLGHPEDPDRYELAKPELPPGTEYSTEAEGWFRQSAHKAGLTQKQASALYAAYNEEQIAVAKEQAEAREKGLAELRRSWGGEWQARVGAAKQLLSKPELTGGEPLTDIISPEVLEQHPRALKFFYEIAKQLGETPAVQGQPGGGLPGLEKIEADIAELQDHPGFADPNHPRAGKIAERMRSLYQQRDALRRS